VSALDRRRFLRTVAASVPAATALTACAGDNSGSTLEGNALDALAEVALPPELGPEGRTRAVAGFRQWLAEYRPVAELNHGYGTGELAYTPAHPGPAWTAQLEALDLESTERYGVRFASLDAERRAGMVRAAIARDRTDRLGDPADARHVAVGLLSYFYATPEAADLCYRAEIGRFACRRLDQVSHRPAARGS
jgi:hypothetical protein